MEIWMLDLRTDKRKVKFKMDTRTDETVIYFISLHLKCGTSEIKKEKSLRVRTLKKKCTFLFLPVHTPVISMILNY